MAKGTIFIDTERCKGCTLCALNCPQRVIVMAADQLNRKGYRPAQLIDPEARCTGCAVCALVCPDVCITVYREARPCKEAIHEPRAS
ncbi:MAG: 4Fe-4S binding protein [Anaerolineae bacterium]|nr:4Fe-4S binding protein [Anaerolineae bacterium]MDW8298650.1 4Fe-4S binding protein [Anaerolineae bacterium]